MWKKCKEATVLGPIQVDPTCCLEDELALLCTWLASEVDKWKTKCSCDSAQETTLILFDSFQEFRLADVKLREVEPTVATHKAILDNWPKYCAQPHEQE